MRNLIEQWKHNLKRKSAAAVLTLALVAGFGTYEIFKPADANAASPIPAAAAPALDDNSVSAISALDQAMEKLAARVKTIIEQND